METTRDILDKLGRAEVQSRLGLSVHSITRAAYEGKFPASWFRLISEMCADQGIDCPADLFAFRPDLGADTDAAGRENA